MVTYRIPDVFAIVAFSLGVVSIGYRGNVGLGKRRALERFYLVTVTQRCQIWLITVLSHSRAEQPTTRRELPHPE